MASCTRWTLAGTMVAFMAAALHYTALWPTEQVVRGVRVAQGQLAGLAQATEAGFQYLAFQGIPYAEPPVGNLRFKLRGLLGRNAGWNELLVLLTSLPRVLKLILSYRVSEDCLFLNVFTPVVSALTDPNRENNSAMLVHLTQLPADRLRPVLVFIHGGGFVRGSSHPAVYGPDYLVERDMVVVTFNYRLGVFGFLSTNTSHAPGNVGLMDQTMALRWVRDNIRQFGGDPNRVTLYGESAGSASVHFQMLSPRGRGLFHAAVMSSSSSLALYALADDPVGKSALLARSLGAPEEVVADPGRRVEFLQSKDSAEVARGFGDCLVEEDTRQMVTKLPFGPTVENCADGELHFLCDHPADSLRDGDFAKIPMIFGVNLHEGTLIHALDSVEEVVDKINRDVRSFVPHNLYPRMSDEKRVAVGSRIRDLYIRPESPNDTLPLIDLYGDVIVSHGVHVAARWHAVHSTPASPVFIYHFTANVFGFYKFLYGESLAGPGHADELGCVFNIHILNMALAPGKRQLDEARDRMTELLANFVHRRTPTSKESKSLRISWPPSTRERNAYLDFGETLEIKTDLLRERMQFWDSVYSEVTRHPVYK
ncbi:Esterase FE4 [Frankliniella fusca]|uniref:Carboxylic ester hydrolase n=1 Tax=Frankliniella fusca TaxID=407009 RepID=A0AAE1LGP7_9NEOP|nr:Esterase FE4 [Frankliniella fusca]